MTSPALEERVTELEVKLAFTEDLVEQLNLTLFRQQERMDLLQDELRVLYARIEAVSGQDKREASDEIPPHY